MFDLIHKKVTVDIYKSIVIWTNVVWTNVDWTNVVVTVVITLKYLKETLKV